MKTVNAGAVQRVCGVVFFDMKKLPYSVRLHYKGSFYKFFIEGGIGQGTVQGYKQEYLAGPAKWTIPGTKGEVRAFQKKTL
jgi:hypothetical protein